MLITMVLLFNFSSISSETFKSNQLIQLSSKGVDLSADEGFLFFNIKSNTEISSITIKPVKKGNKIFLTTIPEGENGVLIKLETGQYYWSEIKLKYNGITFEKSFEESEYPFEIKAGVINYTGSWNTTFTRYQLKLANIKFLSENKFSTDLIKLNQHFADYSKKYKVLYQGIYEDPYPEHFNRLKHTSNFDSDVPLNQELFDISDSVLAETTLFKTIDFYLDDDKQTFAELNPSGKFLVFRSIINGLTKIEVINTTSFKSIVVFSEKLPKTSIIKTIDWIDEDTIYFQANNKSHSFNQVIHLTINNDIISAANHLNVPLNGDLIDPLIQEQNMMLFSNPFTTKSAGVGLFKVDTSNEKSIYKSIKSTYVRKNMFDDAYYWLTDSNSELRLMLTSEYNKANDDFDVHYWFLTEVGTKKWKKIKSYNSPKDIEFPVALSIDNKIIYVLSEKFGDNKSIQMYSTEDFSYIGAYYEDENIDIEGVITGGNSQAISAVKYYQDGFIKYKYFNEDSELLKSLQTKNPNLQLYLIDQNADSTIHLIYGINEYTKGSWYIYKSESQELLKFFIDDEKYDQLDKGNFFHLKIKSKDNLDLEAYLVMPANKDFSKVPLIVNPHGGPIGARDFAYTNEIQHFFASLGFASLKVNYRGSGGYGKKFKELGHQQWGDKIESDINEVVDYVIQNFNVSDSKICAMGSSYGGYSSIMLTILYPQRYQCAISFAGVSDIALMYTTSDFKESDEVLERFAEITGDPLENLSLLKTKSPVYLVDKISKPILLFHGINDERVTIEHSFRLNNSLNQLGKKSKLVIFNNEAHGMAYKESKIKYVAQSLQFIKEQLAKITK
jgi:dipeptidyl aminopeptidase/acylaminoacyl peptidase